MGLSRCVEPHCCEASPQFVDGVTRTLNGRVEFWGLVRRLRGLSVAGVKGLGPAGRTGISGCSGSDGSVLPPPQDACSWGCGPKPCGHPLKGRLPVPGAVDRNRAATP
ncbi:hypothetical protein LEMLEM_LOCUS1215 [Lemmus lemmus]